MINLTAAVQRLKQTLAMDSSLEYDLGPLFLKRRWNQTKNQEGKTVKTGVPNLTLKVVKYSDDYFVFIVENDSEPLGYVRFEHAQFLFKIPKEWYGIVYTPHSYCEPEIQNRGYISSIYKWFLSAGYGLMCSTEHTKQASMLWKSLISKYSHQFFIVDSNTEHLKTTNEDSENASTTVLICLDKQKLKRLVSYVENGK